jgi:methionyl-tRNA formyltransferase
MKIVFFGTSSFAAAILHFLIKHSYQVVAVVTRPDRPKGRELKSAPPEVKKIYQQLGLAIPLLQPEKVSTSEFAEVLKAFKADLFLVVAFGEIIKKNILDIPPLGCINIHASLLPLYRGAAPIQRCLIAGEKETGITIIQMSPRMDDGDILAQEKISIGSQMNFSELSIALSDLACTLLSDLLLRYKTHGIEKKAQNHELATFAPKINVEEMKIDWQKSAEEIYNLIRALAPSPSAWCWIQLGEDKKRLKIKRASIIKCELTLLQNHNKKHLVISCGKDALQIHELQMEGKKTMKAEDFIRGVRNNFIIS